MFPLDDEGYYCADFESHYVETWKAMEKLVDQGLAKSIGLSNFNRNQARFNFFGWPKVQHPLKHLNFL